MVSNLQKEMFDLWECRVYYEEGTDSKIRPILVMSFTDKDISFYKITSQYKQKTEQIRKKFVDIIDLTHCGLDRPSWVDFNQRYTISETVLDNTDESNYLGILSDNDKERMLDYIFENKLL